jgi:hypothetical protein
MALRRAQCSAGHSPSRQRGDGGLSTRGVPADLGAAVSIHMAKSHLRVVAPTEVKRTVAPKRPKNAELRTREHFTPDEVEALNEAPRDNRYGHRDTNMILLTYRHGLRAAEVCDFRWDQPRYGASNGRATPIPLGSRPSTAALTRLSARKASEIAIWMCRLLQASRVAMPSIVALPLSLSDSHWRPRAIAVTSLTQESERIGPGRGW